MDMCLKIVQIQSTYRNEMEGLKKFTQVFGEIANIMHTMQCDKPIKTRALTMTIHGLKECISWVAIPTPINLHTSQMHANCNSYEMCEHQCEIQNTY